MKNLKFYLTHFLILLLFNYLFLNLLGKINNLYFLYILIALDTSFLIIERFSFIFGLSCMAIIKLLIIIYYGEIALETSVIIYLTIFIGFYVSYLYQLYLECCEAYYNPKFSKYDLSLKSYSLLGETDQNYKFYVTNLTEKGFYASFVDEVDLKKQKNFKGQLKLMNDSYSISGKFVHKTEVGFGVKVVFSENWDKLYLRTQKLRILDFL